MHAIEGLKVVTAQEMARIEKRAIEKGSKEEKFMEEAGRKAAAAVMEFCAERGLSKNVLLLVGKGNNGGDAYAAGVFLLEEGFKVRAFAVYEEAECSPLNRKFCERFRRKKGRIDDALEVGEAVVVDGLLGTGFKGKVEERLAEVIRWANDLGKPIVALDIPSGLNGTTGEAECAIIADETVALGLPKSGFFLRQGWNCVGKLRVEDFGLPDWAVKEAEAVAFLPNWKRLRLPKVVRTRHKYQAGFVAGFGGSEDLSGAVKLSGLAALRAGAGIVKVFSPGGIGEAPMELICRQWNAKEWKEALSKAQAVFVGPGLGRSAEVLKWLKVHLKQVRQPCVLDADALASDWKAFPDMAILTPHRGEALRLLGLKAMPAEEELFARVMRFCETHQVVIVLKGAPTFIFAPERAPVIVPRGDPGMATAGSGDVLTGILAALLAQGLFCYEAAVLGVWLHALAGEKAAQAKTSYGMIASDIIERLPEAFQAVMKWKEGTA